MCTSIVEIVGASGAGKTGDGWIELTHSVVSYDHPHHAVLEEAITIDFVNAALGPEARVAVELWGGRVVMSKEELNPKQPTSPIEFTKNLSCPLLGLFGNEDRSPTPEQVNQHEAELKKHGKNYEFHRYDGAGHGFFYYDRPAYRIEQALDGWQKVWAFLHKHLAK